MSGAGYSSPLQAVTTVLPSPTDFTLYNVVAGSTVVLSWPIDNFPANANVVTQLMEIIPLGVGCQLLMPSAINTSLGQKTLIFNGGSATFTVLDNLGGTIVAIPSGAAIYIALISNITAAGTWLTFQLGAGAAAANSAALAGAGLAANGLVLQQIMQVSTLSTNYTSTLADRDVLFNWTGGAGTFTLPTAASVANNWYVQIRNSGSGVLTVQTQGSDLINGAASVSFQVTDSAFVVCDGTNFWTIGLGTINTNLFNFQVVSLAGQSGTYVLPANQQGKVAYRFTGALAGNTNIQVPSTIQQYWVDNQTTGGFTLGIGTAAQIAGVTQFTITNAARFILYCDGSNVLNASTSGVGVPIAINQGGTAATTASAALTNLGGTSLGVSLFTTASIATAQSALQVLSASDAVAWAIII